ncbi:hypothetical protein [Ralstonia solanacearum]|uniref:hypothetical protein n=1 Tax=Ralstonia pseudosolanacearum TaxID=1310165 RepID=UPI0013E356D9|nr:hypothetical protein [Ralstonia pseudosolanacearum]UQY82770.1 hypothetical protein JNO62_00995 [Ralstonia pseudosolanacearum]
MQLRAGDAAQDTADSVQANGSGLALWASRYWWMACSNWRVERCMPQRMYFSVSVANQYSAWFSHDADLGGISF